MPSSSTTYSSGSTIAFNTVKTNHGNAFNRGNYRFTAPSTGLYVFSWSIATHSRYLRNSILMVNSSTFHQVHCQKTYQQCGSTVTVWLSKNSQVWPGWHQRIAVSTGTAHIPRSLDGKFTKLATNVGIESISLT